MKLDQHVAIAQICDVLQAYGAPPPNAALRPRVLVDAETKGHPSHGLQRLPRILHRIERGLVNLSAQDAAYWRSQVMLEVDGRCGLNPVVAMAALRQLGQRVSTTGIALATIRNTNHLGMLAWYVEQAAADGRIDVAMSSSESLVHPYRGTRAMLGANPLAIPVPTAARPLVLGVATSVVSMGKIHQYGATSRAILLGGALDSEGQPTTNADLARHDALTPFGDAKGYGLGLALELLVAALAGSELAPQVHGTLYADAVCNKGDVPILVQPAAEPDLAERLAGYLEAMRASSPADPAVPIRVQGDDARCRRDKATREGFEVDPALWVVMRALSSSIDLMSISGGQRP